MEEDEFFIEAGSEHVSVYIPALQTFQLSEVSCFSPTSAVDQWLPFAVDQWLPFAVDQWMTFAVDQRLTFAVDQWLTSAVD